jgi:hypothetical protein
VVNDYDDGYAEFEDFDEEPLTFKELLAVAGLVFASFAIVVCAVAFAFKWLLG